MGFSVHGQAGKIRRKSPKLLNFSWNFLGWCPRNLVLYPVQCPGAAGGARLVLVTKKEAAELLGVSVDTIERRIKRGDLKGHKESRPQGLTWLIEIPQEIIPQGNGGGSGGALPHADAQGDPSASPLHGELRRLEELVATLQAQIAIQQKQTDKQAEAYQWQLDAKDKQLESKDKQIEQLHVLLQQAQAALPGPRDNRSWWQWLWRKG
jgi:excisionase family DNA binding protein